jgi:hypothetical protein
LGLGSPGCGSGLFRGGVGSGEGTSGSGFMGSLFALTARVPFGQGAEFPCGEHLRSRSRLPVARARQSLSLKDVSYLSRPFVPTRDLCNKT